MSRAHLADRRVEARRGRHDAHIRRRRLRDDRRDLIAPGREALLQGGYVVVGQDDRLLGHRLRHPGRPRQAAGGHARARRRQQPVGVPVIAAGELHHQVATRRPTSQTHRRHGRLRAGGHEAHPFDGGYAGAHRLGQLGLRGGGRPEGQPAAGRPAHRLDDVGVGVAEQGRPPRAHQVDVVAPLGAPDAGAVSALDEDRCPSHRPEGSHGGVDAAGNDGAGCLEEAGVGGAVVDAAGGGGRAR